MERTDDDGPTFMKVLVCTVMLALATIATAAAGQLPARADSAMPAPPMPQRRQPTPNDSLVSPEVASDGRVTLRLYAPKAEHRLIAYSRANQYTFVVDGVSALDPKNLSTS